MDAQTSKDRSAIRMESSELPYQGLCELHGKFKSTTQAVCVGGATLTFPREGPQLLAFFIILFHLTCPWDLETKGPGEQDSPNSREEEPEADFVRMDPCELCYSLADSNL